MKFVYCQQSRVCTVVNCLQWANFTMGPNEQNQHFAELRQKVYLYIHAVVLQRGLPSLEVKNKLFVGKKRKKWLANSSQSDYKHAHQGFIQNLEAGCLCMKNFGPPHN